MKTREQWLETCPLCGQANRCAVMAGQPVASCWCAGAPVNPEALAALPADSIGQRCLCPACARPKGDPHNER